LASPGRFSKISKKAAFSGLSSAGLRLHARTQIESVPKCASLLTGTSNAETRDVVLSSPWSRAIGSVIISMALAACGSATTARPTTNVQVNE
jgi:hypothetical protein